MSPGASTVKLDEEVVEDSEPERVAARAEERVERRRVRRQRKAEEAFQKAIVQPSTAVPQDAASPAAAHGRHKPRDLVDISDSDNASPEFPTLAVHSNVEATSLASSLVCTAPLITDAQGPSSSPVVPVPCRDRELSGEVRGHIREPNSAPVADIQDETEEEEDEFVLDIGRFAYKPPLSNFQTSFSRTASSRSMFTTSSSSTNTSRRLKNTLRLSDNFTNPEIDKVLSCVCCARSWTVRKSASQKIVHIQSCAKKNAFSGERVQELMRDAVEKASAAKGQLEKSKGKAKAKAFPLPAPAPETFLENIVQGAALKKASRRKPAVETVESLASTRTLILDRARDVLRASSSLPSDTHAALSEARVAFPATQAFNQSRLGAQHPVKTFVGRSGTSHIDEEPLPSTQAFRPSRFRPGGLFSFSGDQDVDDNLSSNNSENGVINIKDSDVAGSLDILSHRLVAQPQSVQRSSVPSLSKQIVEDLAVLDLSDKGLDLDFGSPRSSVQRNPGWTSDHEQMTDNSGGWIDDNGWHDDIVMEWEDIHGPGQSYLTVESKAKLMDSATKYDDAVTQVKSSIDQESVQLLPANRPRGRPPGSLTKRLASPTARAFHGDVKALPKKAAKGKTTKVPAVERVEDTVEVVAAKLVGSVKQDRNLYLRILRYEPIHFDVFQKLISPAASGRTSGKFKLRLRAALDKLVRSILHFAFAQKIM
ncbi:hypothetical protein FISHEDRAFT_72678 [Fistulina hepatica ATCC 64428]|nr:hypothetical protein FISHEDRAFT_72678 [Fistulina hepatica ATCC 64428]